LLPGLLQSEERNGGVIEERYAKAKAEFVAAITEDLRHHQPSVVMVPKGQDQALPAGITGLDWLLRNRSFAEEWEKYREHDGSERYRIFRRVLSSPPYKLRRVSRPELGLYEPVSVPYRTGLQHASVL